MYNTLYFLKWMQKRNASNAAMIIHSQTTKANDERMNAPLLHIYMDRCMRRGGGGGGKEHCAPPQ